MSVWILTSREHGVVSASIRKSDWLMCWNCFFNLKKNQVRFEANNRIQHTWMVTHSKAIGNWSMWSKVSYCTRGRCAELKGLQGWWSVETGVCVCVYLCVCVCVCVWAVQTGEWKMKHGEEWHRGTGRGFWQKCFLMLGLFLAVRAQ